MFVCVCGKKIDIYFCSSCDEKDLFEGCFDILISQSVDYRVKSWSNQCVQGSNYLVSFKGIAGSWAYVSIDDWGVIEGHDNKVG